MANSAHSDAEPCRQMGFKRGSSQCHTADPRSVIGAALLALPCTWARSRSSRVGGGTKGDSARGQAVEPGAGPFPGVNAVGLHIALCLGYPYACFSKEGNEAPGGHNSNSPQVTRWEGSGYKCRCACLQCPQYCTSPHCLRPGLIYLWACNKSSSRPASCGK